MRPRDEQDEGAPEPTAAPNDEVTRELGEEDDERLVPTTNVGGAAPTPLGMDSGGNLPGPEDDLSNLSEPEPPGPPEASAVHVHEHGADEEDEGERE